MSTLIMSSLNVVCLISGGKDSLFSILHCMKNGHKIVALANLHPPSRASQAAVDDLDSYMYQTIGHTIIPLYEEALGLPLYREEITGSAVNRDKCYSLEAEADETEALVPLLRRVKYHHPEVNAVSTGAILSDYQRTRVESVALRLGLTPLSFLWQYPNLPPLGQSSLLEHMAAVGQDSRLVKVASGGLDDSFLWQNVADRRTIARLQTATRRFGSLDDGAVLGEGGEYETLAIAGPSCLWRGRIVVREDDAKVIPGDAGSASIRVLDAHVSADEVRSGSLEDLPIPALLEPQFQAILEELHGYLGNASESSGKHKADVYHLEGNESDRSLQHSRSNPNGQHVHFWADVTGEGFTAAVQMHSIVQTVQKLLQESGCATKDVAYTSIILRNMADFSAVNAVYSALFPDPNPPARVTIACADVLPSGKDLMLSVTVPAPSLSPSRRNGLHVQSRSYWAPANIGPYSQAISISLAAGENSTAASLIYIAGQIPLIPASMELAGSGTSDEKEAFSLQAVLALQHAVRVGRVMQVREWASAIAFITAADTDVAKARAALASQAWEALHARAEQDETDGEQSEVDVWDLKFGAARDQQFGAHHNQEESRTTTIGTPPLHVIKVDTLPRNAGIEWAVYGLTKGAVSAEIAQLESFLKIFQRRTVSVAGRAVDGLTLGLEGLTNKAPVTRQP